LVMCSINSENVHRELRITTLVENTAGGGGVLAQHGLSFLIERDGDAVLFDTGAGDLVLYNAQVLGLDLSRVGAVVLSHGHYDHTGGLKAVLKRLPEVRVVAHPVAFHRRYARMSDGTGRVVGCPVSEEEVKAAGARLELSASPVEVLPGIRTTGEVPRVTDFEDTGGPFFLDEGCTKPDVLADDISLFAETKAGLVVVLGCAHAGVVNILRHVTQLSGGAHIHAVTGGMHLAAASVERLNKTVEAFRELGVERISIGHCTGLRAMCRFMASFGGNCTACAAGTVMSFEM